jgi:hypothetical protein
MNYHGKIIKTDSYYDGQVTSSKEEREQSLFTDKQNILKDIIDALGIINSGETDKLSIEVCLDKQRRYRLIKKWRVND